MKRFGLSLVLGLVLAAALAACAGEATPETVVVEKEVIKEVPVEIVVEKEVIKEVEVPGETVVVKEEVVKEVMVSGETVVVTKEVPVEVQVEKVVVKEVTVEKEVIREIETPRVSPELLGKLEGPRIISDAGMVPISFSEAPMLAAMVSAGQLPPVDERLPKDPQVIKPVHGIGKYGGTLRRAFTGPADVWNGLRSSALDSMTYVNWDVSETIPNAAKGWEFSDGGRVLTLFLREGTRWSDGSPFTADDFVWHHENMWMDPDLNPTPQRQMKSPGSDEFGTVAKVDDYTVRFTFETPYFLFVNYMSSASNLGGHAGAGCNARGGFAPSEYLKQFHAKFAGQAAVDKIAKDEGYDTWVQLIKFKNCWQRNEEVPSLTAWETTSAINNPTWVLERNPYYWMVDTDGNQLPYIDRVRMTLAEDLEVLNLRAIAGELDMQSRHIDIGKLPVFVQNSIKGDYSIKLDIMEAGSDFSIRFNLNYDKDPVMGELIQNVDFRRAISLGIDRDEINETFFLGLGVPGSVVPADANKYNPGPEWRTKWAHFDRDQANQMLDDLGLTERDSQGYRVRPDGSGNRVVLEHDTIRAFVNNTVIAEAITQQLKHIGIDFFVKEVERSLGGARCGDGSMQSRSAWGNAGTEVVFINGWGGIGPSGQHSCMGNAYGAWYASEGESGVEPPAPLRMAMELFDKGVGAEESERIQIGKEIWKLAADNVWEIGVVGQAGAVQGVRVVNNNLGNAPARTPNFNTYKTPMMSRPMTLYFKDQ